MARTHNTSKIKQRMAEEALREEEARSEEVVRRARVAETRTRSERSRALELARQERTEAGLEAGPGRVDSIAATRGASVRDETEEKVAPVGEPARLRPKKRSVSQVHDDKEVEVGACASGSGADKEMNEDGEEEGNDEDDEEEDEDEEYEQEVVVSALQSDHKTWPLFEESLREYMHRTRQDLVVKEMVNINRRNASLRAQIRYQGLPDDQIPLVTEEMNPFQRKYICTHGWPERERSKGTRKVHKLRRTDCPFQFLAQVVETNEGWGITLKREVYRRNHRISSEIYSSYPGIRQVSSQSPLMPAIELLVESDAGNASIYDYIRQNSNHRVTMDDVRNLVARVRHSGRQLSDDDAVAEAVASFNLENPKNVSTVNQSARGDTGVISVTTAHMRAMCDNFPEVLQMDCTHKTNKYNYQLMSIVAMDQFGHGQPVQYSLLETTTDWHMGKCLDHFKRANDLWRFVRIVIVDKDMQEVEVIKRKLPNARLLFCHFHVIKWLHEIVRSSKYGSFPLDVVTQLKHVITNMTYARTEVDYNSHRDEFKSLACRDGNDTLWDYFVANWDSCTEMWVMAHRCDLPHFNNHTNNRVESFFGKVKQHIKSAFSMSSTLEALLAMQRRVEDEYRARVEMPGTLRDVSYSEEMNVVLGMTTRWVASALETQYKVAVTEGSVGRYTFRDNGATVTVRKDRQEYLVEKANWTCDCEFAMTMKLPCRYAMLYKKSIGSSFVIPFAAIQPRWFGQSRSSSDQVAELATPFVAKIYKVEARVSPGPLSEREKYRRAQQVFGRISSELTQFSDDAFESAMSNFDEWRYNMRQGKVTAITVVDSTEKTNKSCCSNEASAVIGDAEASVSGTQTNEISQDEADEDSDDPPTQVAPTQTANTQVSIRLNGFAPNVGRPRLNRAEQRQKAKIALKEYNRGIRLRGLLREKDVCEIVACLEEIRPPLEEVDSFISTQQVKELIVTPCFTWKVERNFVPETVRFRLSEKLVGKALDRLQQEKATMNYGQPITEIISVDGDESGDVPVVVIQKIGKFTRDQLEAMKWMWNLRNICSEGGKCITWIFSDVKEVVFEHSVVASAAEEIRTTWPYAKVPNMGFDFTFAELYRYRSGKWLSDDSIRGFTEYLRRKYSNNATVFLPTASSSATNIEAKGVDILPGETLDQIRLCVGNAETKSVFLPVNFDTSHWVCLVIDKANKKLLLYDSMNKRKIAKVLKMMATEIVSGVLDGQYKVTTLKTPRQEDGDSCGAFVCIRFWGQVSSDAPDNVTPAGVTRMRWKMLRVVMEMTRSESTTS